MDGRKACELLLEALQLENNEFRLGNSKVRESMTQHFALIKFCVCRCSSELGCWVGSRNREMCRWALCSPRTNPAVEATS